MVTTNLQAGGDVSERGQHQVLVIGRDKWSMGALGPILRGLGVGFALGILLMATIAALAR